MAAVLVTGQTRLHASAVLCCGNNIVLRKVRLTIVMWLETGDWRENNIISIRCQPVDLSQPTQLLHNQAFMLSDKMDNKAFDRDEGNVVNNNKQMQVKYQYNQRDLWQGRYQSRE